MKGIMSLYIYACILKEIYTAPTKNNSTIIPQNVISILTNDTFIDKTSEIQRSSFEKSMSNNTLQVKLFDAPQSFYNSEENTATSKNSQKEEENKLQATEETGNVTEFLNSSTTHHNVLKSNENDEKIKILISSLDVEKDDVDPVEVLTHLNELLKGSPDAATIDRAKMDLEKSLKKFNITNTRLIGFEHEKDDEDVMDRPSSPAIFDSRAFTIIKSIASVAGSFFGSLIQTPLTVFNSVKERLTKTSSTHQSTARGSSGGVMTSSASSPAKPISVYCFSITNCIRQIVYENAS